MNRNFPYLSNIHVHQIGMYRHYTQFSYFYTHSHKTHNLWKVLMLLIIWDLITVNLQLLNFYELIFKVSGPKSTFILYKFIASKILLIENFSKELLRMLLYSYVCIELTVLLSVLFIIPMDYLPVYEVKYEEIIYDFRTFSKSLFPIFLIIKTWFVDGEQIQLVG